MFLAWKIAQKRIHAVAAKLTRSSERNKTFPSSFPFFSCASNHRVFSDAARAGATLIREGIWHPFWETAVRRWAWSSGYEIAAQIDPETRRRSTSRQVNFATKTIRSHNPTFSCSAVAQHWEPDVMCSEKFYTLPVFGERQQSVHSYSLTQR